MLLAHNGACCCLIIVQLLTIILCDKFLTSFVNWLFKKNCAENANVNDFSFAMTYIERFNSLA